MLRVCLALMLSLLPTLAGAAPLAHNRQLDTTVEVRALDDPNNPYKNQYQDWDRWLIANAQPADSWPTEDSSANYYVLSSRADENGWLLPQVEMQRLRCERLRQRENNILNSVFMYEIDGAGPMPDDMLRAAHTAIARVRAPYLPTIPKWLADSPPEWSIVLPDGRVVLKAWTRGEWNPTGFQAQSAPDSSSYGWWLYSADGEYLSATLPESYWFETTFPGLRAAIAGYAQPYLNVVEQWGRIHVYSMDSEHKRTYANFEWDGTPLPVGQRLPEGQDGNAFLGIHGFDLPVVYAEQQRLRAAAQ